MSKSDEAVPKPNRVEVDSVRQSVSWGRAGRHPSLELRLLPAAIFGWAAAWLAVGLPAWGSAVAAGVLAGVGSVTAGLVWHRQRLQLQQRQRRGRKQDRQRLGSKRERQRKWHQKTGLSRRLVTPKNEYRPGRHLAGGRGETWAGILLGTGIVALVLAVTAGQAHTRERSPLTLAAAQRATVALRVEVAGLATPLNGQGSDCEQGQCRIMAVAQVVNGREIVSLPMVLLAPGLAKHFPGEGIAVTARLLPTADVDRAGALGIAQDSPRLIRVAGATAQTTHRLRTGLRQAAAGLGTVPAALVPGIVVGDDRGLPRDVVAEMRTSSLTHLTAVSGEHIAILVTLVGWAVRRCLRWVRGLVQLAVIAGLVLLVLPQDSVLRAGVMGAIAAGGTVLARPGKALAGLALAVIILLLLDPWASRSFGFALSVLATGGILGLARPAAQWLAQYLPRPVAAFTAIPLVAQLACTPVLVLLQPQVSLVAIPANVMAAPAVAPTTVLGILALLVAPFSAGIAAWLAWVAAWGARWIAGCAQWWASWPLVVVPWPGGMGGAVLLALVTSGLLSFVAYRRWRQLG